MQNAELTFVDDIKQNLSPKSEVLFAQALTAIDNLINQPRNSYGAITDSIRYTDGLKTNNSYNATFNFLNIPRSESRKTFFLPTLPERRLASPSSFNLNLKFNTYRYGQLNIGSSTPTDFSAPVWFSLDFTPFPFSNPLKSAKLLNLRVGTIYYNATDFEFILDAESITINLLDAMLSRNFSGQDFRNNAVDNKNNKITQEQLNQILNIGDLGLELITVIDTSALSINNQDFISGATLDLLLGENLGQFMETTAIFQYYGNLSTF
jgi:hypothetical protein